MHLLKYTTEVKQNYRQKIECVCYKSQKDTQNDSLQKSAVVVEIIATL